MENIAVTKENMTVARQEPLSPFGLLTQMFTAELVRRSSRELGAYRPMQLAYLEEEDAAAAPPAAPELHIDLDVNVLLERLRRERETKPKEAPKAQTPAERIIERVIVREREILAKSTETRRLVVESGGRRMTAELPLGQPAAEQKGSTGKKKKSEGKTKATAEGKRQA